MGDSSQIVIDLNAVILAVTDEEPRILAVPRGERLSAMSDTSAMSDASDGSGSKPTGGDSGVLDSLPVGPLDPARDRTLELGLRGWVREQTGVEVGYVEQLYTFGDRNRDPRESRGWPRVISIAYLTLGRESEPASGSRALWRAWYEYLPWEDWREGRPRILERRVEPALGAWVDATTDSRLRQARRERVDISFGLGGATWDGYRALDRYELLYEVGLVPEAKRARGLPIDPEDDHQLGRPMCFDHRRVLATALSRLRGKIKFRPVVFELMPNVFTLFQLQRVVEALSGQRLHKQNFRRLVEKGGLVEGTGDLASGTGGRPAELFRFRREVLRERPTPGVGLPALPAD